MCHLYNLCPIPTGRLFIDKGNTMRNIPNESTYFINQQAFNSGDTLRIQEKIFYKMTLFLGKIDF